MDSACLKRGWDEIGGQREVERVVRGCVEKRCKRWWRGGSRNRCCGTGIAASAPSVTLVTLVVVMVAGNCAGLPRNRRESSSSAVSERGVTVARRAGVRSSPWAAISERKLATEAATGGGTSLTGLLPRFGRGSDLPDCGCFWYGPPVCGNTTTAELQRAGEILTKLRCNEGNNCEQNFECQRAFFTVYSYAEACTNTAKPQGLTDVKGTYQSHCKPCYYTPYNSSLPFCNPVECNGTDGSFAALGNPLCWTTACSVRNSTCDVTYKRAVAYHNMCHRNLTGILAVGVLDMLDRACEPCNVRTDCSTEVNQKYQTMSIQQQGSVPTGGRRSTCRMSLVWSTLIVGFFIFFPGLSCLP